MSAGRVYLDYAASAPLRPEARAAMEGALAADEPGNPSSVHAFGRIARRALEAARGQVAALAGVAPGRVVLTSGGTEANALALTGFPGRAVIVSAIEHESALAAAPGGPRVPVDGRGVVDIEALDRLLAQTRGPALVSVMRVNNQTGVIQPLDEVGRVARAHGALVHCDAVQAAGWLAVGPAALGADLVSLSAHKIGGPAGVGALALADGVEPRAMILGGGQERGRRAGTENRLGLIGFGAAAAASMGPEDAGAERTAWRDRMERAALAAVPGARVIGAGAPRVGGISCLALPGVAAETQVMALDLAGVAVSAGAACSSGRVRRSHVLDAMGLSGEWAGSAVRISLGWASEWEDVERFLAAWVAMARALAP